MFDLLLDVHGFLRWPVLLLGLVGMLWAVGPRRSHAAPARIDRALGGAFLGLLDLQVLLGVVLFLLAGADRARAFGHVAVMLGAVILAHVFSRRLRQAGASRDAVLLFGLPLAAIVVGVTLLLPPV